MKSCDREEPARSGAAAAFALEFSICNRLARRGFKSGGEHFGLTLALPSTIGSSLEPDFRQTGSRIRLTKVRLAPPTLPVTCQHPAVGKVIAVD